MKRFLNIFLSIALFFVLCFGALHFIEQWIEQHKLQPVADEVALQLKESLEKKAFHPSDEWLETFVQTLAAEQQIENPDDLEITYSQLKHSSRFDVDVVYQHDGFILVEAAGHENGLKPTEPSENIHLTVRGKPLEIEEGEEAARNSMPAESIETTLTSESTANTDSTVSLDAQEAGDLIQEQAATAEELIQDEQVETKLLSVAASIDELQALVVNEQPDGPSAAEQLTSPELNQSLWDAVVMEDEQAVKDLLAAGADPNGVSHAGSMLSYAVVDGNLEILRSLIDYGADVTKADNNGFSPLDTATMIGDSQSIQLLLEFGSDGYGTLRQAVEQGDERRVLLLLKAGVKLDNNTGTELLEYALTNQQYALAKLLETYGAERIDNL